MTFPVPFAGLRKKVVCETDSQMHALMLALTTCHQHNFAVETEQRALYVSEKGAECAGQWYKTDPGRS